MVGMIIVIFIILVVVFLIVNMFWLMIFVGFGIGGLIGVIIVKKILMIVML